MSLIQIETSQKLQYYTVPQIAKLLNTSKSFIYSMINQGKLKAIRITERRTRISIQAFEEFTQQIDKLEGNNYNKVVVQPRKGLKINGTTQKSWK